MFAGSDWAWVGIEGRKPLAVKDFKDDELHADVVLDFIVEVGVGTGFGW